MPMAGPQQALRRHLVTSMIVCPCYEPPLKTALGIKVAVPSPVCHWQNRPLRSPLGCPVSWDSLQLEKVRHSPAGGGFYVTLLCPSISRGSSVLMDLGLDVTWGHCVLVVDTALGSHPSTARKRRKLVHPPVPHLGFPSRLSCGGDCGSEGQDRVYQASTVTWSPCGRAGPAGSRCP